ncbi:MAG: hypothetical protein IJ191_03600 [Treponema sp.]|nr:hypothetical protein [Treponema sp.]
MGRFKKYFYLIGIFIVYVLFGACKNNADGGSGVTHTVGDILLEDGSWILQMDVANMTTETLNNKRAVGVYAYEENGKPHCVGLAISDMKLKWAKENTIGYKTRIDALVGTESSGVKDGSGSLTVIKNLGDYTQDNYPAFYWAEQFNANDVLYKGKPTKGEGGGWYIPSIYELKKIYNGRIAINASLQKLNTINNTVCKITSLGNNVYWSSSQVSKDNYDYDVYEIDFNFYSPDITANKDLQQYVLVVHVF